jgi:uncharacterized protein YecE (DUF72 family)
MMADEAPDATGGERRGRAVIRVGTCAWSDHEDFYPPGLKAVDRLAYYADKFPVVEINSSYYHLLPPRNYAGWAERTPDGFVFNVKAFGQLTQHRREEPPTAEGFAAFRASYRPLAEADKLRAVLFQFPPWFTDEPKNRRYLGRVAEEMAGDRVVVEFRHSSWLSPERTPETLGLLAEFELGYVVVDAPQVGSGTAPLVPAVTTPDLAYVRLHGRNTATWYKKTRTTGERFDYLYAPEELREWLPRIEELARRAAEVHVMFNNNRRNYATVNAEQMMRLLGQLDRPPETDQGLQLPLLAEGG